MSNLQVLNVIITVPEDRGGGAVRAGLQFGKYLEERTTTDTVMMEGEHDDELAEEFGLGEQLHYITSRTVLRDISKSMVNFEENFSNVLIWTRLDPPQPLGSYDVVHIHNAVPLAGMASVAFACRSEGIPYCVTTHGISKIPELPDQMDLSRVQQLVFRQAFLRPYRWVLNNAAHLFALSKSDQKRLESFLSNPSVSVVPNGVEVNPPEPSAAKTAERVTGIEPSQPLLLFVGKIRESKGIVDLLNAYRLLESDASLVVAGPTQNADLAEQIREFDNEHVQYPGYLGRDELDALFQRADLFVFPTRSDVFPLVTLEAMAAHTPVVSTDVGGIPEQLNGESSIIIPPNDPQTLASKIDELLSDDEQREGMAQQAVERVNQRFSWETVAEETIDDYRRYVL